MLDAVHFKDEKKNQGTGELKLKFPNIVMVLGFGHALAVSDAWPCLAGKSREKALYSGTPVY